MPKEGRFPYQRNEAQVWGEVRSRELDRTEVMSGYTITDALGPKERHHPTVYLVHYGQAATYAHYFSPDYARKLGEALIHAANHMEHKPLSTGTQQASTTC